jgi:hypothetical protein
VCSSDLGPARWTSMITHGTSIIIPSPMFSCIRLNPGPDVAVMDFTPAALAPRIADMEAISSSIWMYVPPILGMFEAMYSATSVAGVIGYPAKNLHPAYNPPAPQAWSPYMKKEPGWTAGIMSPR